jgi:hypothetical protein
MKKNYLLERNVKQYFTLNGIYSSYHCISKTDLKTIAILIKQTFTELAYFKLRNFMKE